jgi:very-short-patch-repair endonuclease
MPKDDVTKRLAGKTKQARRLRQNETVEEYHLWSDLRARWLNQYKFARQVPLGPYTVDFICREHRLVVEVDGFQHADNVYDNKRTDWQTSQGYGVLRFWSQEISRERGSVLETILAALQGRLEASTETPSFYSQAEFTKKNRERP